MMADHLRKDNLADSTSRVGADTEIDADSFTFLLLHCLVGTVLQRVT